MNNRKLKGEPIALAYYGRHNLPPMKRKYKKTSLPTKINRNFYQSLRNRGRTHTYIMNLIQPERYQQFLEDITPLVPKTTSSKKKISFWNRLFNLF
jgi:hypothetical protein